MRMRCSSLSTSGIQDACLGDSVGHFHFFLFALEFFCLDFCFVLLFFIFFYSNDISGNRRF